MRRRNQIAVAASITWVLYICGSFAVAYLLGLVPWEINHARAIILYETNHAPEAERALITANRLLIPSRLYNLPRRLTLNRLGKTEIELGEYAEAEQAYRQLLAIVDKKHASESSRTARALIGLAQACRHQGKPAEAESLYLRAVSIRQKIYGSDSTQYASALQGLGRTYVMESKLSQGDRALTQAVAIFEKQKPNSTSLGYALEDLADCRFQQKRYREAEALCRQSLSIERITKADPLDEAVTIHRLALIYTAEKRYDDAARFYQQALAAETRICGEDSIRVANIQVEFAGNYRKQKKYRESEALLRQAAYVYSRLAPDSMLYGCTLFCLGTDCYKQKKYADAAVALERALAVYATSHDNHPLYRNSILEGLAKCYDKLGRPSDADKYRKQLSAFRQSKK